LAVADNIRGRRFNDVLVRVAQAGRDPAARIGRDGHKVEDTALAPIWNWQTRGVQARWDCRRPRSRRTGQVPAPPPRTKIDRLEQERLRRAECRHRQSTARRRQAPTS
jgi:hypothetical protein